MVSVLRVLMPLQFISIGVVAPNFQRVEGFGSVMPLITWEFDVGKNAMGPANCGPLNCQKVLNSLLLSKSSAVTDAAAPTARVGRGVAGKVAVVSESSNILLNPLKIPP